MSNQHGNQQGLRAQIMEMMQEMYRTGLRRAKKLIFRNPFLHWIEEITLPRNVGIPELSLFFGEKNQSTLEYRRRLTL